MAACPYNSGVVGVRCYSVTVTYPNYPEPAGPLLRSGQLMNVAVPSQLSSSATIRSIDAMSKLMKTLAVILMLLAAGLARWPGGWGGSRPDRRPTR